MKKLLLLGLAVLTFALSGNAQEKQIQIGAGGYHVEQLNIKRAMTLRGRFQTKVNSEDAVELYLLDADNLEKWKNNQTADFYFQSGRGTAGVFYVKLKPGTYFLIVNNRFSTTVEKAVTLTID